MYTGTIKKKKKNQKLLKTYPQFFKSLTSAGTKFHKYSTPKTLIEIVIFKKKKDIIKVTI